MFALKIYSKPLHQSSILYTFLGTCFLLLKLAFITINQLEEYLWPHKLSLSLFSKNTGVKKVHCNRSKTSKQALLQKRGSSRVGRLMMHNFLESLDNPSTAIPLRAICTVFKL